MSHERGWRAIVKAWAEKRLRDDEKLMRILGLSDAPVYDPYTCLMAAWNARATSTPPVITINGRSPFLTIHMEQP